LLFLFRRDATRSSTAAEAIICNINRSAIVNPIMLNNIGFLLFLLILNTGYLA